MSLAGPGLRAVRHAAARLTSKAPLGASALSTPRRSCSGAKPERSGAPSALKAGPSASRARTVVADAGAVAPSTPLTQPVSSRRAGSAPSTSLLASLRSVPRPLRPSLVARPLHTASLATPSLPPPLPLRCTVLDASGSVKVISGTFSRAALCAEHHLEPRDLRKVDSRVPNVVPTILVRDEAFLVNVLHVRALVKKDQVLLFDSFGSTDTALHSAFIYALTHNLSLSAPTTLPYEFRALESILSSVLSALSSEVAMLRGLITSLLNALEANIDRDRLLALLLYTRKLRAFDARCRGTAKCVRDLLEDDLDMEQMYLTERRTGTGRHQELELLLESFDNQVEELIAEGDAMSSNINNTREIIDLILDSNRNNLLALDLRTSITTLGVSAGTLWAGLFGMNLISGFEQGPIAFYGATGAAFASVFIVATIGHRKLERARRVGLMTGGRGRQNVVPSWWGARMRKSDRSSVQEPWLDAEGMGIGGGMSSSDALNAHGAAYAWNSSSLGRGRGLSVADDEAARHASSSQQENGLYAPAAAAISRGQMHSRRGPLYMHAAGFEPSEEDEDGESSPVPAAARQKSAQTALVKRAESEGSDGGAQADRPR